MNKNIINLAISFVALYLLAWFVGIDIPSFLGFNAGFLVLGYVLGGIANSIILLITHGKVTNLTLTRNLVLGVVFLVLWSLTTGVDFFKALSLALYMVLSRTWYKSGASK